MTTLWTIGHSTRSLEDFVGALQAAGIESLVDIRRYPTSRRNPQFRADELKKALFQAKIQYLFLGDELGGWRKPRKDSRHVGIRNEAFRGYADWMEGGEFRGAMERLRAFADARRTAVMCAESNPKSCHRRLLSDHAALALGWTVLHLHEAGETKAHEPVPGVQRVGAGVAYPSAAAKPLDAFGTVEE